LIDLHTHILPGIDDGARNLDEALSLADALADDGVRIAAATPHLRADHPRVRPSGLAGRVAQLQREIDEAGIPLELCIGGEVDVVWAYRASDDELRQVSFGERGHDLLLETPYGMLPPAFEGVVASLRDRGFRITLAHPERNPTFKEDPRRLSRLVHGGVLVQVSADSLTELPRRSRTRRLAARLVGEGLAHVIATDSHGAASGRRAVLSEAVAAAERLVPATALHLVTDAPAAILTGDPLFEPAEPLAFARSA
jgi:protein-tyrosine phosphatase